MGFFKFIYVSDIFLNMYLYRCAYTGNILGLSSKKVNFVEKQKYGEGNAGKYSMRARMMFVCYLAATQIEFI